MSTALKTVVITRRFATTYIPKVMGIKSSLELEAFAKLARETATLGFGLESSDGDWVHIAPVALEGCKRIPKRKPGYPWCAGDVKITLTYYINQD